MTTRTTSEPKVSFIIPVRNDPVSLRRCLDSIMRCDYPHDRLEIIIADNGSVDSTAQVARDAGATVLELPGLRVAELRNRAAELASGDVLAFVDADHEIGEHWLRGVVDAIGDDGVAAVGAMYHAPAEGTWVQRTYDLLRSRVRGRRDVEWLASGNLAVRRGSFREVGGFDTRLETCEDVDLCRRLRLQGLRVVADEQLWSVHHGDPRSLRELFSAELWRGRDNLRVSLRGPFSWRGLPSIATPILELVGLSACVVGLAMASDQGLIVTALGMALIAAFVLLRAAMMCSRASQRRLVVFPAALAVAAVYECSRAMALVFRKGHRRA